MVNVEGSPPDLSPLYIAVIKRNYENVQRLLQNGTNVDDTPDQPSPLVAAVIRDYPDIVELLLRNGANVHGNQDGTHPLTMAAVRGHCDIAKLLLQNGVCVEGYPEDPSPLIIAIYSGFRDIVELFLRNGANVEGNANSVRPLILGIQKGDYNIIKLLLEEGASVNGNPGDLWPLDFAIEEGRRDIVELLLQKGASAEGNLNFLTPLYCAMKKGNLEIVELLLQNGASLNGKNQFDRINHLKVAIEGGHCDIVRRLLRNGSDLNGDIWYLYFLSIAAKSGNLQTIKVLLSSGAHLAIKFNNDRFLLEGADLEEPFQLFQHPQVFQHLFENCFCNHESVKATGASEYVFTREERRGGGYHLTNSPLPAVYLHHLIKITAVNLHPLDEELADFTEFWNLAGKDGDSFRNECMFEVGQMKKLTLGDPNITYFDILMKDTYQVACYMRNSCVAQLLNSNDLNDIFPKYASILKCQFQKGSQRMSAVEEGIKVCHSLSNQFQKLPREISEIILSYLSVKDLLALKNVNRCTSF